ncbi:hypothetical protein FKP32DRAFT_1678288 [Trametes sanguinea]|nr:hypothetical protein FKP32DRAFT_1678288 [Trametes sanguinea]
MLISGRIEEHLQMETKKREREERYLYLTANCTSSSSPSLPRKLHRPDTLKGDFDSTGFSVGCKSASAAANNPNCCTGNTRATCPPSGVEYYSYFNDNCPNSLAYAYDDFVTSSPYGNRTTSACTSTSSPIPVMYPPLLVAHRLQR